MDSNIIIKVYLDGTFILYEHHFLSVLYRDLNSLAYFRVK